jgi:lycopene cyclase domain-containing protein
MVSPEKPACEESRPVTYFGFLLRFIVPPLVVLALLAVWDFRRNGPLPSGLRGQPALIVLLAHVIVAVLYTTPWDNYLVATGVWWYDPALVTGLTLGWVPIEEYTFFVLQTLLTGSWLIWLARRLHPSGEKVPARPALRRWITVGLGVLWAAALGAWLAHWPPATYLAITLTWALPPVMLQTGFGADILWHQRRLVAAAVLVPTLYLAGIDALAISAGTWTINPAQSTAVLIGGKLPLEELVFFLVTNILIGFGMVLVLADESHRRAAALIERLTGRR